MQGADSAYVLVAGPALAGERAAADLRHAGFQVLRTGRYLGEPVDGFVPDWFVRVVAPPDAEALEARVSALFGSDTVLPQSAANLRVRLLTAELASARERALRSETEVERLGLLLAERTSNAADADAFRALADTERRQRETAEANLRAALDQLEAAAPLVVPSIIATPRAAKRLRDEVSDVLDVLLPRIRLVGESLDMIAVEFGDRRALYRVLAELEDCGTTMPPRWKTVQGAEGWIEKSKVGNGQDDQGRIYACFDRADRRWDVLVSHKSEQERDIAWLKRQ